MNNEYMEPKKEKVYSKPWQRAYAIDHISKGGTEFDLEDELEQDPGTIRFWFNCVPKGYMDPDTGEYTEAYREHKRQEAEKRRASSPEPPPAVFRVRSTPLKIAVLATGGLDSTVLLHMIKKAHNNVEVPAVTAIYIDYGQTVKHEEMRNLSYHCHELGVPLIVLGAEFQEGVQGLTDKDFVPLVVHDQDDPAYWDNPLPRYSDTHIEGRNTRIFLEGLAWCAMNRYDRLYTGMYFCEREWANQWSRRMLTADNSPGFLVAMNNIAQYGFSHPVHIQAPFFEFGWNKYNIIDLGSSLGVNMTRTHSCYFPSPCGKCDNCLSREKYTAYINSLR